MVYLWFINVYHVYHLKNHPRQPLPIREVLAAGSAEHHLWAVGRLHVAALPWDRAGGTATGLVERHFNGGP